ncbi:MAG: hypothetical protein Q8N15_08215, partial [Bacillota bacterium]|nr:hypothetical protein [Bacillota bacterium]
QGRIALMGLSGFVLMLALFYLLAAVVEEPAGHPDGFFGLLYLAIPLLLAWASATVGLVFGLLALLWKKDFAVINLLCILTGAFVMFWAIAEVMGHG